MRKKDLMFTHALLVKCAEFMEDQNDTTLAEIFNEYEDVNLSGPRDIRAQKTEQKAAVFALLDDLTAETERLDETEGAADDTDENTEGEADRTELTVA